MWWHGNECYHGMWGSDNKWFSSYYFTNIPHDAIEMKVRVWMICTNDPGEVVIIQINGAEVWRKDKGELDTCGEGIGWSSRYSCFNTWPNSQCYEDVVLTYGHKGLGPDNRMEVTFSSNINQPLDDEGSLSFLLAQLQ